MGRDLGVFNMTRKLDLPRVDRMGASSSTVRGFQSAAMTSPSDVMGNPDEAGFQPFLSERGMVLIGAVVFSGLVWSTLLLWALG